MDERRRRYALIIRNDLDIPRDPQVAGAILCYLTQRHGTRQAGRVKEDLIAYSLQRHDNRVAREHDALTGIACLLCSIYSCDEHHVPCHLL